MIEYTLGIPHAEGDDKAGAGGQDPGEQVTIESWSFITDHYMTLSINGKERIAVVEFDSLSGQIRNGSKTLR